MKRKLRYLVFPLLFALILSTFAFIVAKKNRDSVSPDRLRQIFRYSDWSLADAGDVHVFLPFEENGTDIKSLSVVGRRLRAAIGEGWANHVYTPSKSTLGDLCAFPTGKGYCFATSYITVSLTIGREGEHPLPDVDYLFDTSYNKKSPSLTLFTVRDNTVYSSPDAGEPMILAALGAGETVNLTFALNLKALTLNCFVNAGLHSELTLDRKVQGTDYLGPINFRTSGTGDDSVLLLDNYSLSYGLVAEDTPFYFNSVFNDAGAINSAGLVLGSSLILRFYATVPDAEVLPHMTFTDGDQTISVEGERVSPLGDEYKFDYPNISPRDIKNILVCSLYDGEVLVDRSDEYSVYTYADRTIRSTSDRLLKKLLQSLVTYGECASAYCDAFPEAPNVLTVPTDALLHLPNGAEEEMPTPAEIRIEFDYKLVISLDLPLTEGQAYSVLHNGNSINVTADYTENGATLTLPTLGSTHFDDEFTIAVTDEEGELYSLTFSTGDCLRLLSSDEDAKAVAEALYEFGRAAKIYRDENIR